MAWLQTWCCAEAVVAAMLSGTGRHAFEFLFAPEVPRHRERLNVDAESLFWLIYAGDSGVSILLQWSHSLMAARRRAALAETPGEFIDGFQLDRAAAKKVPKAMIGRVLSAAEAEELLDKISQ